MAKRPDRRRVLNIAPPLLPLATSLHALKPDPENPRKHEDWQIETLAASLRLHGQRVPLVVGPDDVVYAGNATLAAARSLGWTHVAAVRVDAPADKLRALSIADNRSAELSRWDFRRLADLLPKISREMLATWSMAEFDLITMEATPANQQADEQEHRGRTVLVSVKSVPSQHARRFADTVTHEINKESRPWQHQPVVSVY